MDLDRYVERFREIGRKEEVIPLIREEAEQVIKKYNTLPLTLQIEDEPMRRLCQVLTNNKFDTFSSCEGHGKQLPHVYFFLPRNNQLLGHLAYVVSMESYGKHFEWNLSVNAHPGSIPSYRKYYSIDPAANKEGIDPNRDHTKLLEDIDILGISILKHFDEIERE